MKQQKDFDVLIIGGSYSGLSAALALGRSLRHVLILDAGQPCNRQTPHSHNFITHDGETPRNISEKAKEQVLNYPTVIFQEDFVVSGKKTAAGFEVETEKGNNFRGKKLIFATGVKDIMPNIEGFSDCWGISAIHCPYCHGYEFKNAKTGIMANGERAFHIAALVRNLTKELTILTQGKAEFTEEQFQKLKKNRIKINEIPLQSISYENGYMKSVHFADGKEENFKAVYAALPFEQSINLPVALGCELTEIGHLKVDFLQKTTIPGIFACGDNASPMRSVAYAVATGNIAGAMANNELCVADF
ncbi:NAD(P)/FAD-dependent oxidoreductase [Aequorivita echinoideorum]|uniref:NAD(P)/FAD-dependent oxidoreductase n=1 Tax=Aequorivita echinoideorum TaxID=1549647 RepID=A0ABS5S2E0_9FLAO|nr:NAD(P)/FAD-dependent oxidoreductase [Aequorivita echinoideorum]MBT0607366.1 NAD(P)/FAD-dependent oxidoreductase [Aequorivita echinoideorum]